MKFHQTLLAAAGLISSFAEAKSGSATPRLNKRDTAASSSSYLVNTNVGAFQGQQAQVGATVREWLGIRYGKSPNGTLRFRPPQRASIIPQNETFNATSYSPSCPQNRGASYQGLNLITPLGNATDGEDCLSLNIWSPSPSRMSNSSGAAVMLWIYGGAFSLGTSDIPYYRGDYLVRDNDGIIVVTINYRTNIFGFPSGSPALSAYDSNLGLKDQRMAIEWVYNNIRNFGGDPEKIILFGESAGASSIGAYPYTYASDPIVRGLIMESGSEYLMASEAVANTSLAQYGWESIASSVGCSLNSSSNSTVSLVTANEQLQCLQKLDFSTIQQAISNNTGSTTYFLPTMDNVSVFNAADYTAMSNAGLYAPLPVLIGSNDNEGTILTGLFPSTPELITQYGFTCPAGAVAAARQNMSVPVWQYRYLGEFPTINLFPALGVFHTSEIPLVFGTYNDTQSGAQPSAQEIATSQEIQKGWVAFAKDPVQGLTNYGWPSYQANGTTLIQLGKNNMSTTTFNNSQAYNAACRGVPLI